MRRSPRGGWRIGLLAAAATLAAACANVLGVADYHDAITPLCKCSTLHDCEDRLAKSLETATEDERQEWLERYTDLHCEVATCDSTAYECFYTAPGLCAEPSAECEISAECCGFDFEDARAGAGCCAGAGGGGDPGACCSSCRTCADVLTEAAETLTPDTSKLCKSHEQWWDDVAKCRNGKCEEQCATLAECAKCVANNCKTAVNACVAATDP